MTDLPESVRPLNLVAIDITHYSNALLIELSDGKRCPNENGAALHAP
ncbi:hypothetical protein [Burkholderia plantarii]